MGGNRIDVLVDGEEIFAAMLAAIRSARRTITYEPSTVELLPGTQLAPQQSSETRLGYAVSSEPADGS